MHTRRSRPSRPPGRPVLTSLSPPSLSGETDLFFSGGCGLGGGKPWGKTDCTLVARLEAAEDMITSASSSAVLTVNASMKL